MKIPNGLKEIIRTYGNPNNSDFAKKNLTMFKSAPLTFGRATPKIIKIYAHRLIIPDLTAIFAEIAELERKHQKIMIKTFDGCYNKRVQRGGTKASTHSWAIAVDLNAATNGLGHTPNQSQALVKCFTKRGWRWVGG